MANDNQDDLRYNQVQQKSVHNTFQRAEGIADQFLYWRVRSLEVDVHHKDPLGNVITGGDWSVHHDWYDPISTVSRLSQFLDTMRALNRANPRHEVVTLFIDIKDGFPKSPTARHGARAFDALLAKHLGKSRIYTPRRFVNRQRGATSLRQVADSRGWPTLKQLRGKFIVVLTGSPTQLKNYASSQAVALDRLAFLSRPVDSKSDIPGRADQVFFNVNGETNAALINRAHAKGYVSRAYYVNSPQVWNQASAAQCHHLATDKVNERIDPWAVTRNVRGFPFRSIDQSRVNDAEEAGAAIGIWARSDDLWSESDSFFFHHRRCTKSTIDATYDFSISGPNSHTETFVKGALVARAGLEPDAAYFAIVRVGQKHGLRVQYRRRKGAPTTVMAPRIGPSGFFGDDIDQDTIAHVQLTVSDGGRVATAWGSYDRRRWTEIGSVRFSGQRGDKPLRYHGLGVSSHGQTRGAKFLFMPADGSAAHNFTKSVMIGGKSGHAGWVDPSGTGRWLTSGFSRWRPSGRGGARV